MSGPDPTVGKPNGEELIDIAEWCSRFDSFLDEPGPIGWQARTMHFMGVLATEVQRLKTILDDHGIYS